MSVWLPDAPRGRVAVPVEPGRPLLVVAHVPPSRPGQDVHWTAVRRLLVADLLVRLLERRGARVEAGMVVEPGSVHGDESWLDAVEADVHQLGGRVLPELAGDQLAGAAIHVGSARTEAAGIVLVVPGAFDDVDPEDLQATGWTTFTDPEQQDAGPLAPRAALLATPLHDPAWRSIEAERSAARRLLAWRAAATGWRAAEPGQVSAAHVAQFDAALDQGLDTHRALAVLDAVVDDPRLSPGDKLATFEAFDTILGLALTDLDPPDDEDAWRWAQSRPARPTRRPAWLGPPEDLLPGLAPVQLILVRTVDTLVVVTNVRAYPTGVAFTVRLRLRTPLGGRRADWMDHIDDLLFSFDSSDPGQVLRLWVEDAEGRRSGDPDPEVDRMAEQAPRQPLLQVRGGGGSETDWDAESWLWPLPPPGPLTFACAWPARDIPETRVSLDVEPVLRAAGDAVPLFPGAG